MRYLSSILITKILFGSIAALIDILFALQLENIFVTKLMIQPTITGVLVGSLAAGFALFVSSMLQQYMNRNTKYFNIYKPFADIWGTLIGALIVSGFYYLYLKYNKKLNENEKINRGEKLVEDKVKEENETYDEKVKRLSKELELARTVHELQVKKNLYV